jgi:O-antigen biosynthesis protein
MNERSIILLAMPSLTMGGAEASLSRICRRLRRHDYRIVLITTQPAEESKGDSSGWFEGSIDAIYHLPQVCENVFLWSDFVFSLIEREPVSVLWQVGSSYVYSLLPEIHRRFPRVAVVDLLFNPVGHTQEYVAYRRFIDHVVVEHDGMKAWLLDHGTPARKISVIPNGIDLDEYSPRPKLDWRTRAPRLPDDGRFVAAFFGRLSEEKGPDIFLDLARDFAADVRMEFLVCGIGPMEPALREMAARKKLNMRIHSLGRVSSRDYLPCCDAVVVCSRLDGRPNVVMESLAMGIPVIASRVGGIPDMLPKGQEDLLCEPGDVPALAEALRRLAEDRNKWEQYSSTARRHAEEHFSVAKIGEAYGHLFSHLQLRRPRFARVCRSLSVLAPLLHLICHFKNAYLVLRLYRSGAWAEVVRLFDRNYYAQRNPIIGRWELPALLHYVFLGFRWGSDPSPQFRTHHYLAVRPDVARSGLNPLLHYVAFGRRERGAGSQPCEKTA